MEILLSSLQSLLQLFFVVAVVVGSDIPWFVFVVCTKLTGQCRGPENTDTHSLEISECLECRVSTTTGLQPTRPTPSLTSYRGDTLTLKYNGLLFVRNNYLIFIVEVIISSKGKIQNTYMVCLKQSSFKWMNKIPLIPFPGYTK